MPDTPSSRNVTADGSVTRASNGCEARTSAVTSAAADATPAAYPAYRITRPNHPARIRRATSSASKDTRSVDDSATRSQGYGASPLVNATIATRNRKLAATTTNKAKGTAATV